MNKIKEVDQNISFWFSKQYHHTFLNTIMIRISKLGDLGLLWIVIIAVSTIFPNGLYLAQRMLFALLLATFLGQFLIKTLVKRKRPAQRYLEVPLLIKRPKDYSFPSGHTTSSFACATVICFYMFPLGVFALVFAMIMGISRIYLFVHYTTDIIAAIVLGSSIGILVMLF